MPRREQELVRYSFHERAVHWMVVLCFLYAALTGLALWSPRLFWLAGVFGGGETVRAWHPWSGVVFSVFLGMMFGSWAKQMRLDAEDRQWLRRAHRYAVHDHAGLPEAGRFNAGQKLLFWLQSVAAVLLFASGVVLWFPSSVSRALHLAAILVHSATAVASMGAIIVHVYMGTAVVPGSFGAMIHGRVRRSWAEEHHPKWAREVSKN